MNPYSLTPFYPPTTTPLNYYSYPYIQSGVMLNSSIGTSLNSSSGYESAGNETSFIDPGFSSPKVSHLNFIDDSKQINIDEDTDENMSITMNEDYHDGRKKRRILSRPQRQEANRRERHRMEIINDAYEELRNVLPFKKGRKRQKMSRMDTVDGAIQYIHSLLQTLHGPNYNFDWAKS